MDVNLYGDHGLRRLFPVEKQLRVKSDWPENFEGLANNLIVIQDQYQTEDEEVFAKEVVFSARQSGWQGQALIVVLENEIPDSGLWAILAEDPLIRIITSHNLHKKIERWSTTFTSIQKNELSPPWKREALFHDLIRIHYAKKGFLDAMSHHLCSYIRELPDGALEIGFRKFDQQLSIIARTLKYSHENIHFPLSFDEYRAEARRARDTNELASMAEATLIKIERTLELYDGEKDRDRERTTGILYICSAKEDYERLCTVLRKFNSTKNLTIFHASDLNEAEAHLNRSKENPGFKISTILSGYRFYQDGRIALFNGFMLLKSLHQKYNIDHLGYLTGIDHHHLQAPINELSKISFNKYDILDDQDPAEVLRLIEFIQRTKIQRVIAIDGWFESIFKNGNKSDIIIRELYKNMYLADQNLKNNIYTQWQIDLDLIRRILKENPFDKSSTKAERKEFEARKVCSLMKMTRLNNRTDQYQLLKRVLRARCLFLGLYNYHNLIGGTRATNFPSQICDDVHHQKLSIIYSLLGVPEDNPADVTVKPLYSFYTDHMRIFLPKDYTLNTKDFKRFTTAIEREWVVRFRQTSRDWKL